jgi:hypothetical protein
MKLFKKIDLCISMYKLDTKLEKLKSGILASSLFH